MKNYVYYYFLLPKILVKTNFSEKRVLLNEKRKELPPRKGRNQRNDAG